MYADIVPSQPVVFRVCCPLTSPQVDHAILPAQSSLDFHSEAHLFAN